MADRPRGYGMTAELAAKKDAKFDSDQANDVFMWMEELIGEPVGTGHSTSEEVQESLKDGVALCLLANAIQGEEFLKPNRTKNPFKMMENIGKFLDYCYSQGCKKLDMFQTVDLYEGQNIPQVINGLLALGRKLPDINPDLPAIGPKEATENKREFSEEQLQEGQTVIGLQMGSNTGASQAGMTAYGTGRQIH